MATDSTGNSSSIKSDDYSWFKVHWKSIRISLKTLLYGVIKNFRRVTWHSKRDLTVEYVQVIAVLAFMTVLCFLMFLLASHI